MNDGNAECDPIVDDTLTAEISDEDLEAAVGAQIGAVPTLFGTYCFTCPA